MVKEYLILVFAFCVGIGFSMWREKIKHDVEEKVKNDTKK
jgi:hypothetical protein